MISPNQLAKMNSVNNFLAYKGTTDNNIMFVGSCRMTPIMFYFNEMLPEYNVYGIYVPHWTDTSQLCKNTIQKILNNTSLVITESVKNYNILNTDKKLEHNFFKTFDTNAHQIKITNLELRMYIYELVHIFKIPYENMLEYFKTSKNKLALSLINKNQEFIWQFINENLHQIKLFGTHNHPTKILSILSFIHILKYFNRTMTRSFIDKIIPYDFLEGNSIPITKMDIERYNFTFKCKIFDNDILNTPNFFHSPTEQEKTISDSTIEKILNC